MSARNWITAACAAALIAGCANAPRKSFDRQAAAEIRKVAIVQYPGPEKFQVMGASQVPGGFALYMFGALGGAVLGTIEVARAESQASSLTKAMHLPSADVTRRFYDALEAKLRARGYAAMRISWPLRESPDQVIDYSMYAAGSQAVIAARPTVWGYNRVDGRFQPFVAVEVQMAGLSGAPVHYSQTLVYGKGTRESIGWLDPEARFGVADDIDKLYASGPLAAEAVLAGVDRLAERIAADL